MLLSSSRADLDRRVTVLESKYDYIDMHGTRGVGVLQTQVTDIAKDMGEIKGTVESLQQAIDSRNSNRWQTLLGIILALIPLYVVMFLAVLHK